MMITIFVYLLTNDKIIRLINVSERKNVGKTHTKSSVVRIFY